MKLISTFLVTLFLSFFAQAANEAQTNDEAFIIPVQQSEMNIDASDATYHSRFIDFEVSSSNWTPNQLNRPSLITTEGHFQTSTIPLIGITRIAPYAFSLGGVFETEIGLSYAQLQRTGSSSVGGNVVTSYENMNVTALKLGMNYRLPGLFVRSLQPSVEIALLPTWLSSEKSTFEKNGVSATGVIGAAAVKLLYCPEFMQKSLESNQKTGEGFGIAYLTTSGSIGGSDLSGSGLQAVLRMGL